MSLRTIETAAWFALYAGIIAFLLGWNSASPTFNAVYVERSQADWIVDGSREYTLGTAIRGGELSPFFADGWWRPEAEHRWGRGGRSTIVLNPAADIAAGSRLVARMAIFPTRWFRSRPVHVVVNGVELAWAQVGDAVETIEVALPALREGAPVAISFESLSNRSPLLEGYGTDQRELGIRFYDLTILPPA